MTNLKNLITSQELELADSPKRPKLFRSKLFKLPPELLGGVDALADDGHSADHIRQWLKDNNALPRLVPNRKTISAYLVNRRQRQTVAREGNGQILSASNMSSLSGVDPGDRPELIRRSIAMVTSRIELLKRIQQTEGMDPRWERTMVDQLDLLRKLLDSADAEKELSAYWEGVASLAVRKYFSALPRVIRISVEKVYGTSRTSEVLGHLLRDYKQIDFDQILKEASVEIKELLKGNAVTES